MALDTGPWHDLSQYLSCVLSLILLLATGIAFAASSVADRVNKTAFIQVEANSFKTLTPQQQALAYWLSRAAIAIDPIIYDQESRFGRQKRVSRP